MINFNFIFSLSLTWARTKQKIVTQSGDCSLRAPVYLRIRRYSDAISRAKLESILSYTEEENTPDVSHMMLHIVVHCSEPDVLDRYIHKHVEFASYYVAHEFLGTVLCVKSDQCVARGPIYSLIFC